MNRTDRLYALAEELRRAGPQGRTGAQLAEHFEVATRTVKRDITALQESGLPIWATVGPGGGYVLDDAASLAPLAFSAREATAIAVALAVGRALPFAPEGRAALTKLLAAMRPEDRVAAEALGGRVWVRPATCDRAATASDRPGHHRPGAVGSSPDPSSGDRSRADRSGPMAPGVRPLAARVVDEAIRDQVVVVIDYTDRDGRSSERRPVEPLAYALDGDQWFLLGWCRRRRAGRWFRLDRIDRAVLTTEHVEPRDLVEVFGPVPADVAAVDLR